MEETIERYRSKTHTEPTIQSTKKLTSLLPSRDHSMEHGASSQMRINIPSLVKELMASGKNCGTENRRIGCKIIERPNNSQDKPDVVFIGPYNNDPLHPMQKEKMKMLHQLLRGDDIQKNTMLTRLAEDIRDLEREARDHYADRANRMESREFVEMLLLDGCYIVGKFVHPHCCHGLSVGGADGTGSPAGSHSGEMESIQNGGGSGSQSTSATAASQSGSPVVDQSTATEGGMPMHSTAVPDVFYLVDNQIPFCVLDTIHNVLHGRSIISSSTVVANILAEHLGERLQNLGYSTVRVRDTSPWHLLHLVYKHFPLNDNNGDHSSISINTSVGPVGTAVPNDVAAVASAAAASTDDQTVYRWRSATQYREVGVKFKKQPLDVASRVHSILDVKLDNDGKTLLIPPLTVDDNTCTMLRNLMALERSNPTELGRHITAYCLFMSQLACNVADVALFVKKGIIVHAMRTDSDAADRLAGLCSGVIVDLDEATHNYLHKTRRQLELLYESRTMKWFALLQHNHCSTPWMLIALVVAFLGFTSGIVQSVYTSLAYYYRR